MWTVVLSNYSFSPVFLFFGNKTLLNVINYSVLVYLRLLPIYRELTCVA